MSNPNINNNNLPPLLIQAPSSYALSGKIMLITIIILIAIIFFMITLQIYVRRYLLRAHRRQLNRRRTRRRRASHIIFYVDSNSASSTANTGLDTAILNSLPLFVYSSLTHHETYDCAICLSEFEENEPGRVLPKCHHIFHIECVDMWFVSHSTCPICRASVEPEIPVQPDIFVDTPVEPDGLSSLDDQRKGVPRRTESRNELQLSSAASNGFISPGSRLPK